MPSTSNCGRQWLLLAACLAFSATLSIALGQDIFWDTKNYHLYNAWAFLQDRYTLDIAPASMQSYFNPLLDVPYFWLATGPLQAWPRTLAGLQGLWYGLLVFLVFRIAMRLAKLQRRPFGLADACAALIGATGTMAVSQVGSTTNEIALALLSLLSLYKLMPLLAQGGDPFPARRALIAGLLSGLAAGLKPTAIIYPPALAVALLLALGVQTRAAWQMTSAFAVGVTVAFLASYGPWAWHLYQATGNPTFPMFNQLFHSSLTAATNGTDGQFRPRSVGQWLFYPFYWLTKQRGVVTETAFADPRYALAMLAVFALVFARLCKRQRDPRQVDRGVRFLAIFASLSFVLWMSLFSILRYAIPIEALTGLLLLAAIRTIAPLRAWPLLLSATSLLLLIGVLATTTYPNWWRGAYAKQVFDVDTGTIEPDSLVIFVGSPNAYLAPMFPHAETVGFVGLSWFVQASRGYGLWDQIQQRLRDHAGPRYVVFRSDSSQAEFKLLNEMLPLNHLTECRDIVSSLEVGRKKKASIDGPRLCRLTWLPPSTGITLESPDS
jgi:hypothetical protein